MTKGRWPFPGDAPTAAARKVALAYREALAALAPETVEEMDKRFRGWGQQWVNPTLRQYEPDDMIPAVEAANLLGISTGTMSQLRIRQRIKGELDGKRFLYKVSDVYALSAGLRRRRSRSTDTVNANGSSASPASP